jgi:hypothetical protein
VSKILKFADDTKRCGVVANQQDMKRLKNDLKNLESRFNKKHSCRSETRSLWLCLSEVNM